ncbi:MAG TPA: glycosyltransferase family 1 protein, partial [Pyrinomonadaceae bacterium]|nr:glycosyltransferase family 1 protein [Pyrinomonadaceae bacterium]
AVSSKQFFCFYCSPLAAYCLLPMLFGLDAIPLTEPRAGVGHYTFELARALAEASPEDEFELAYPSTYPPVEQSHGQTLLTEEPAGALPQNLKFARVAVGPLGRHWWSVGLPRYASRRGFALFHGTNYEVPLWKPCARVVTVHDLSLLLLPETHEARRVRRARRRLPLMARAAEACITPTESVRREVCEHLGLSPSKVFAVPEAARSVFRPLASEATKEERRRLGIGEDFLLAVGTVEPRKNLQTLVRAFEEFARARPASPLQLVVVGNKGWLSDPLFDGLNRSPFKDRVLFKGYVSDETLRALYSSCRAFVYPSLYEGFGLPPLEAMACGAPVVASRIPSLKEVTNDAALLFDPKDSDELARHLVNLLEDEGARRTLSAAGLRRAGEFSWARTARMTLDVYAEALKGAGRRTRS